MIHLNFTLIEPQTSAAKNYHLPDKKESSFTQKPYHTEEDIHSHVSSVPSSPSGILSIEPLRDQAQQDVGMICRVQSLILQLGNVNDNQ